MTKPITYVVKSSYISGTVSEHRKLAGAAKSAYKHKAQYARVYAVDNAIEYSVPVCWDVDGTWALGSWDDRVPAEIREAVTASTYE